MSLSYEYNWNPIKADFSDANDMYNQGYTSLSKVGDIFSKMRDQQAAQMEADREAFMKSMQMEEARRQFQLGHDESVRQHNENMLFNREKLAQELDIARMKDVTERYGINARLAAARAAARAAGGGIAGRYAMINNAHQAASSVLEQVRNVLPTELQNAMNANEDKIKNILGDKQQPFIDARKAAIEQPELQSKVDQFTQEDSDAKRKLKLIGTPAFLPFFNPPQKTEEERSENEKNIQAIGENQRLIKHAEALQKDKDYMADLEKRGREAEPLIQQNRDISERMRLIANPVYQAKIYADAFRAAGGGNANLKDMPIDVQIGLTNYNNEQAMKSGAKRDYSKPLPSQGKSKEKTHNEYARKAGFDTKDWDNADYEQASDYFELYGPQFGYDPIKTWQYIREVVPDVKWYNVSAKIRGLHQDWER